MESSEPQWVLTFIDGNIGCDVAMGSGLSAKHALTRYLQASGRDLNRYFDKVIVVAPVEGPPMRRGEQTRVLTARVPDPSPGFVIEEVNGVDAAGE